MKQEEYLFIKKGLNSITSGCKVAGKIFEAIQKENIELGYFSEEIKCFADLLVSEGEFFKSVAEKKSQDKN